MRAFRLADWPSERFPRAIGSLWGLAEPRGHRRPGGLVTWGWSFHSLGFSEVSFGGKLETVIATAGAQAAASKRNEPPLRLWVSSDAGVGVGGGRRQSWGLQKGLTQAGTPQKQRTALWGPGLWLGKRTITRSPGHLSPGLRGLGPDSSPPAKGSAASCCLSGCRRGLPGWHRSRGVPRQTVLGPGSALEVTACRANGGICPGGPGSGSMSSSKLHLQHKVSFYNNNKALGLTINQLYLSGAANLSDRNGPGSPPTARD